MENNAVNESEESKRNQFLREMCCHAIAIKANQVEIHSGCMKMEYYKYMINEIAHLEEIDLEIFTKFAIAFSSYPIEKEREGYNKDFLARLDLELSNIDEKYRHSILNKCDEIIEKFEHITKHNNHNE